MQPSQIIVFVMANDGTISHHKHIITKNQHAEYLTLFGIDYYERYEREANDKDKVCLVGMSQNKIHYINLNGEVTK